MSHLKKNIFFVGWFVDKLEIKMKYMNNYTF